MKKLWFSNAVWILMLLVIPQMSLAQSKASHLNLKICSQFSPELLANELLLLSAHLGSDFSSESCQNKAPKFRSLQFSRIFEMEKSGPSAVSQVPKFEVLSPIDLSVQALSPIQSELNRAGTAFRAEFSVKSLSGKLEKGFFTFIRNSNSDDIQNLGCAYFLHQPSLSVSIKTCQ